MRGPWAWRESGGEPPAAAAELRAQLGQLKMALVPIALTGTEDQQSRAREILTQTRTALYRILAEEAEMPGAQEAARAEDPAAGQETSSGPESAADPQEK